MTNDVLTIHLRAKIKCLSERPSCSACLRRRVTCSYEFPAGRRTPTTLVASVGPPLESAVDNLTSPVAVSPAQVRAEVVSPVAEDNARPITQAQSAVSNSQATQYDVGVDLGPGECGNWSMAPSDWNMINSHSDFGWIFGDPIFGGPVTDYSATFMPTTALLTDPSALSVLSTGELTRTEQTSPRSTGVALQDKLIALVGPASSDFSASKGGWPIQWEPEAGTRDFVLPLLEEIDTRPVVQRKYFDLKPVTDATRKALADALQLPFEYITSKSINLENWPAASKLDYCIDQYFAHFHPVGCGFQC